MKHFISILCWFLGIAGILLLVLPKGWFPSFYDVRYTGIAFLLQFGVLLLIPKLFRAHDTDPTKDKKNKAVDTFQFFLGLVIAGNASGELGLYQLYRIRFPYDKLLHFASSFLGVAVLPTLLERRFGWRKMHTLPFVFLVIVALGVGWEVYEFMIDRVWGTHLYGVYGLNVRPDTFYDLVSDTLGALGGLAFVLYRHMQRWGDRA